MTLKPRKLTGSRGGHDGPRSRREEQRGNRVDFPLVDRKGVTGVQIDPKGAIGTDPARGINVRAGAGTEISSNSPYAVNVKPGRGTRVDGDGVHVRTSSSVRVNKVGDLIATPTTAEVLDAETGESTDRALGRIEAQLTDDVADLEAADAALDGRVTTLEGAPVGSHVSNHASGGGDELDVTGLAGLLADPQTPLAHTHPTGEITGLGTLATQNGTFSGTSSGTNTGDQNTSNPNRYVKAGTTNYVSLLAVGVASGVALTTRLLVAGTAYAVPFIAPDRGGTLDQVEVYVTTGVGATNVRFGIYANLGEASLYPGARLIDCGAFTSAVSSEQRLASISQALTPGALYWFVIVSDGAPTIRAGSTNQAAHILGTPSSATTTWTTHLTATMAYGALPTPFPTAGAAAATGAFPVGFLRFSA